MSPRGAVVIPALDEEATIRAVVESVLPHGLDVIVIDDGSRDGTRAALESLAVTLIVHPQRLGKGAALLDGWTGRATCLRSCSAPTAPRVPTTRSATTGTPWGSPTRSSPST